MIITIDGPAGAGKSTVARLLAARLGFDYLDTGAMYRAVTLAALRAGCDPRDAAALRRLLDQLDLRLEKGRVYLQGEDVTDLLRSQQITAASGAIADSPVVRAHLVALQRQWAAGRNVVCEGRDQGTLVFPQAECKFFLTAAPQERARRRHQEMLARGEALSLEEVLRDQEARDRRDAARTIAPLVPAADAVILDTTTLSLEEVVDRLAAEVRRRGLPAPAG
jgi:cytidylate kinase